MVKLSLVVRRNNGLLAVSDVSEQRRPGLTGNDKGHLDSFCSDDAQHPGD